MSNIRQTGRVGLLKRRIDAGKTARHETRNRNRGDRARDHLERARQRERTRLEEQSRARERARHWSPPSRTSQRLRAALLFAASIAAGVALATPLQRFISSISQGELGQLATIAIQGNERHSFEEIAAATGVIPGSALGETDTDAIEQRLLDQPWIRTARVVRLPPGKLLLRIEERRAVAVMAGPGEEAPWRVVDSRGIPLERAEPEDVSSLPHFRTTEALADGEAWPELLTAIELATRIQDPAASPVAGLVGRLEIQLPRGGSPEGWVLLSKEHSLEVVLGHDDLDERLDLLEQLLAEQEPEARKDVRIDLRFANRAVLRRTSASG